MARLMMIEVLALGIVVTAGSCNGSSSNHEPSAPGGSPDAAGGSSAPSLGSGGASGGGGGAMVGGSGGAAGSADGSPPDPGAVDAAPDSPPTAGKTPMCGTMDLAGGVKRAPTGECDVEDEAIDFDVAAAYAGYTPARKPGYDPAMTPVSFTDYGTAFTGSAVQQCHPYCYAANLTVGLDFIAGADQSLRGEALFDFPPTVAPIVMAAGRNSLGWIWVDGPALPAGTTLTAQMVLRSKDKGILVANASKTVVLNAWTEFKYFPIQGAFTAADLTNITAIGFRLTLGPTAAAKAWQGVVYADHFQLRVK